jgi:cobalt/nickel transport system permease protein
LTFRGAASALAVLFARSAERAESIHRAMVARGFDGRFPALRAHRATFADYAFAALACCAVIALRLPWSAGTPWIR